MTQSFSVLRNQLFLAQNLLKCDILQCGVGGWRDRSNDEQQEDLTTIKQFITSEAHHSVFAFSDGSVYNGNIVGCGACAAILVYPVSCAGRVVARRAVGKAVDSLTRELEGIVLSLEMMLQAFTNVSDINLSRRAFLVCDCSAAIDMILHRESYGRISRQMFRILHLAKSLKDIQVVVHLTWVPSHCGIVANKEVDKFGENCCGGRFP